MKLIRDESASNGAAAFDTLLRACGHTVTVRKPKPKKRRSTFNTFDAEPKGVSVSRSTHKSALGYVTGIRS